VRILDGLVTIEGYSDFVFALDGDFHRPNSPSTGDIFVGRYGVNLLTDLCFFYGFAGGNDENLCRYQATRSEFVDLAPILDKALDRIAEAGPAQDRQLCNAADAAAVPTVDGSSVACSQSADASCFFDRSAKSLAGTRYAAAVRNAIAVHGALQACLAKNADDAARAGDTRLPRWKMQYAPYAPEMRRALSCETGHAPRELDDELYEKACEACPSACRAQ
jgi:hypothetical protein